MCRRGVHRISLDLFCSWCLVFVFLSGSFAKRIDIPISLCLSTVFCCLVLRETHYKILNDSDHKNANNLSSKFGACVCVSVSVSLCVCVCVFVTTLIDRLTDSHTILGRLLNVWGFSHALCRFSPMSKVDWITTNATFDACACVCVSANALDFGWNGYSH